MCHLVLLPPDQVTAEVCAFNDDDYGRETKRPREPVTR